VGGEGEKLPNGIGGTELSPDFKKGLETMENSQVSNLLKIITCPQGGGHKEGEFSFIGPANLTPVRRLVQRVGDIEPTLF